MFRKKKWWQPYSTAPGYLQIHHHQAILYTISNCSTVVVVVWWKLNLQYEPELQYIYTLSPQFRTCYAQKIPSCASPQQHLKDMMVELHSHMMHYFGSIPNLYCTSPLHAYRSNRTQKVKVFSLFGNIVKRYNVARIWSHEYNTKLSISLQPCFIVIWR